MWRRTEKGEDGSCKAEEKEMEEEDITVSPSTENDDNYMTMEEEKMEDAE